MIQKEETSAIARLNQGLRKDATPVNNGAKQLFYYLGILLLLWMSISPVWYVSSGSFVDEINQAKNELGDGRIIQFCISAFRIFVSTFGIYMALFLYVSRSNMAIGMIALLLCWAFGYTINPLWYLVPDKLLIAGNDKPTNVLYLVDGFYAIFTVVVIVGFVYLFWKPATHRAGPETYR